MAASRSRCRQTENTTQTMNKHNADYNITHNTHKLKTPKHVPPRTHILKYYIQTQEYTPSAASYVRPPVHPSACWLVRPPVCPSVRPSICLSICPSARLSMRPPVHPSDRLSIRPPGLAWPGEARPGHSCPGQALHGLARTGQAIGWLFGL